jgi:DNA-binding NarL/FixJ family response regulator
MPSASQTNPGSGLAIAARPIAARPIVAGRSTANRRHLRPASWPATSVEPARVLIADGDAASRRDVRNRVSADRRFRLVGEAADDTDLARLVRASRCQLLVLDLAMPGRGGFEVLAELTGHTNRLAVVAVSSRDDGGDVDRALALGALGYVLKTAPASEIMIALRALATGGAYVQPSVARDLFRRHFTLSDGSSRLDLSRRQLEVLRALQHGLSNKQIAGLLGLAQGTVNDYIKELYLRLGVASRAAAVSVGFRRGILA